MIFSQTSKLEIPDTIFDSRIPESIKFTRELMDFDYKGDISINSINPDDFYRWWELIRVEGKYNPIYDHEKVEKELGITESTHLRILANVDELRKLYPN